MAQHNIIAYGGHPGHNNDQRLSDIDEVTENGDEAHSSGTYDSDTSLSSNHSTELGAKSEGDSYILQKKALLLKMLEKASKSRYSPMMIHEQVIDGLPELEHPPHDRRSFLWGSALMLVAAFLFSVSTTIIKWNHSFGRENFEIFVFRMFIQLLVTSVVASISIAMNQQYCYESVALDASEWDEGDDTATDLESDVEAELGQLVVVPPQALCRRNRMHRHKHQSLLRRVSTMLCIGRRKGPSSGPCCKVRCACTRVFTKFWRDSSRETRWYIVARGLCGGTGPLAHFHHFPLL